LWRLIWTSEKKGESCGFHSEQPQLDHEQMKYNDETWIEEFTIRKSYLNIVYLKNGFGFPSFRDSLENHEGFTFVL